jgi:hypothetical protein
MTCRGCASQKCSNLINRKSFGFLAEHAGKIPSILPFYPRNRIFRECSCAIFDPIFSRPPSGARISIKPSSEMKISKFWIRNVMRILLSENYFIPKCSCKNALLPVKLPWRFAIFLFLLGLREFLFEKEWYTSLVKAGHDEVKNPSLEFCYVSDLMETTPRPGRGFLLMLFPKWKGGVLICAT